MQKEIKFTPTEVKIIKILYAAQRPITTRQVATKTKMAWQTAKTNLLNLENKGYVEAGRMTNRIYW